MGAAVVVMIATFFSRIFGFVREMVMGAYFGAGTEMGAYRAAFIIPNIFRDLLADVAISSAFLPVFADHIAQNDKERALRVANSVLNMMALVLGIVTILGIIFAHYLVPIVAPGFTADQQAFDLTTLLSQIIFIALVFMGVSGVLQGILNTYGNFRAPAIAPVIFNLAIIISVIALSKYLGIISLAIGVVVGSIAPLIYQIPHLRRTDYRWKPTFAWRDPSVKKVGILLVPVIISLGASEINITVAMRFASQLGAEQVATLGYAIRLWTLPLGLFAIAISTVLFPTFSKQAALGDIKKLREAFSLGVRMVLLISFPAMAVFLVLGVPIIELLLERGKFDHHATIMTAGPLFYYSFSLFSAGALYLVNRAFYAFKETRTPMLVAVFSIIVNYFGNFFFTKWVPIVTAKLDLPPSLQYLSEPHGGIALAYSLVSIINFTVLMYFLKRRIGGVDGRNILKAALKGILAAIVLGISAYLIYGLVAGFTLTADRPGLLINLLGVGAALLGGALLYIICLVILKTAELKEIYALIAERKGTKTANEL